jgi:hypothetical protein
MKLIYISNPNIRINNLKFFISDMKQKNIKIHYTFSGKQVKP